MHNLTSYSFYAELKDSELNYRIDAITVEIADWLKKKGATDPNAEKGDFVSLTGDGSGNFSRKLLKTEIGNILELELNEIAHTGQRFTTAIQVTWSTSTITVFSTLSVTSLTNIVAPINIYPRCPQIIRTLIEKFGDWKFGESAVPKRSAINATNSPTAYSLCKKILDFKRNLPIVVVSIDADEVIWTGIQNELAYDLVGIADVAFVDEETSWVLTDELGKEDSCYLGAIRLYWPPISLEDGEVDLKGTVWTASRLLDDFGTNDRAKKKFLSVIRDTIMSTAVLTISPPKLTRDIHNTAARERLRNLKQKVLEEELDAIIEENSNLSSQLDISNNTIASLKYKVDYLQGELAKKTCHLRHLSNLASLHCQKKARLDFIKKLAIAEAG